MKKKHKLVLGDILIDYWNPTNLKIIETKKDLKKYEDWEDDYRIANLVEISDWQKYLKIQIKENKRILRKIKIILDIPI